MRVRSAIPSGSLSRFNVSRCWVTGLVVMGCGRDPILERAEALEQEAASGRGGGAGSASPPPQDGGMPGATAPPQPATDRSQPPPDEGMGHTVEVAGPSMIIGGTVELADVGEAGAQAVVRIDVFDGDQQDLNGPRPSVVALGQRTGPGPFQIKVPKSTGKVWVGGFADINANGRPDHEDPSGWYAGNPVSTDAATVEMVLRLEVRASSATKEME